MKIMQTTLVALIALAAGRVMAGEAIDETRDMDPDGIVDIHIPHAIVTIRGWDRSQFRISGELGERSEGYELREVNRGIRFEEHIDQPRGWRFDWGDRAGMRSTLDIQVPFDSVVRLEGTNLEIEASDLRGNTVLEAVNGEISLAGLSGIVMVETVNGDIDARSLDGRIELSTVNGRIDDRDSSGNRISLSTVNGSIRSNTGSQRISAETVNGDIELELATLEELEASTVSGRLEVTTALAEAAQVDLTSVNGRIELMLPAATSARFSVTTAVGGRIDNQLSADKPERRNRYVNSAELDFVINGGSSDVSITTVSGDVSLRPR